jgi:hypothetical protein
MAYLGYQQWPEFYEDYRLGSRLADTDPFFLPSRFPERNYLGLRYIAPETRGVRREVQRTLRVYYDCTGCVPSVLISFCLRIGRPHPLDTLGTIGVVFVRGIDFLSLRFFLSARLCSKRGEHQFAQTFRGFRRHSIIRSFSRVTRRILGDGLGLANS